MGSLTKDPDISDVDVPRRSDDEVAAAARRQREAERNRRGRTSTILTGPGGLEEDVLVQRPQLRAGRNTLLGQ